MVKTICYVFYLLQLKKSHTKKLKYISWEVVSCFREEEGYDQIL